MDGYIVGATGIYQQYTGWTVEWNTHSDDPTVADIVFVEPVESNGEQDTKLADELTFTSKSNPEHSTKIYEYDEHIGNTFTNDLYLDDEIVGYDQGYGFLLREEDSFTTDTLGYTDVPTNTLTSRTFALDDGSLMKILTGKWYGGLDSDLCVQFS